jgi:hypothetical protein
MQVKTKRQTSIPLSLGFILFIILSVQIPLAQGAVGSTETLAQ